MCSTIKQISWKLRCGLMSSPEVAPAKYVLVWWLCISDFSVTQFATVQTGTIQPQQATHGKETDRKFPSFLISSLFLPICFFLCFFSGSCLLAQISLMIQMLLKTEKNCQYSQGDCEILHSGKKKQEKPFYKLLHRLPLLLNSVNTEVQSNQRTQEKQHSS